MDWWLTKHDDRDIAEFKSKLLDHQVFLDLIDDLKKTEDPNVIYYLLNNYTPGDKVAMPKEKPALMKTEDFAKYVKERERIIELIIQHSDVLNKRARFENIMISSKIREAIKDIPWRLEYATFYHVVFDQCCFSSNYSTTFENCKFWYCIFDSCVFEHAKFTDSIFGTCYITSSTFVACDFTHAHFNDATIYSSSMRRCNLINSGIVNNKVKTGFYLDGAHCHGVVFTDCNGEPSVPYMCPKEGSFIGWKKAIAPDRNQPCLIKLRIPAKAARTSAYSEKCRCSEAKVLSITSLDGKTKYDTAYSMYDAQFVYTVGDTVKPFQKMNPCRWDECSSGIHFFMNKDDAINY